MSLSLVGVRMKTGVLRHKLPNNGPHTNAKNVLDNIFEVACMREGLGYANLQKAEFIVP